MQLTIEIENHVLHYNQKARNYQQTTVTMRVAHTSVIAMNTYVWRLGASRRMLLGHENYQGHERNSTSYR